MARRSGVRETDAEDLTQDFFCRIMQRSLFPRAEQAKGKLRSYLLMSFKNFRINEWRKEARRPDRNSGLDVDWGKVREGFPDLDADPQMTPDRIYLRQWAMSLLETAMEDIATEMEHSGKGELFAVLRPLIESEGRHGQQEECARAAGISYQAFRVTLSRLRRRFGIIVRGKVADTLDNPTPAAIDEELLELRRAMEW